MKIIAGKDDAQHIKTINTVINDDGPVKFENYMIDVLRVPCHTRGHVLYYFKELIGESEEIYDKIV